MGGFGSPEDVWESIYRGFMMLWVAPGGMGGRPLAVAAESGPDIAQEAL